MRLSIREKVMLLALGVIAIIFLGTQLLISPAMNTLNSDKAKLQTEQSKVLTAQEKLIQANGVDANIKKAYDSAVTAASSLLPSLDKPSLQIWLFGFAKKYSLKVTTASLGDPTAVSSPAPASGSSSAANAGSTINDEGTNYAMKTYADEYLGHTSSATSSSGGSSSSIGSDSSSGTVMMSTVNLQMTGSYSSLKSFLDAIRDTKRYVVISSLDCSKQGSGYNISITLSCYAAEKLDNSDNILGWTLPAPSGKSDLM